MSQINLFASNAKCYCAQSQVDYTKKLDNLTIINDTRDRICISKLDTMGNIREPFVCLDSKSGIKLDGKISPNERIKIRTPVTEYYECSGIISPENGQRIKVSNIERQRWNIC